MNTELSHEAEDKQSWYQRHGGTNRTPTLQISNESPPSQSSDLIFNPSSPIPGMLTLPRRRCVVWRPCRLIHVDGYLPNHFLVLLFFIY